MPAAAQNRDLLDTLTHLSEQVAHGTGIEVVEVQLKGAGKARLLRLYIDKPGGVTHGDCELISERLGRLLDEKEVIPDSGYTLEVSSPGVERKLSKARDFERVVGQDIKLTLKEPFEGQLRLEGKLVQLTDGNIELVTLASKQLWIPLERIQKANLKFVW